MIPVLDPITTDSPCGHGRLDGGPLTHAVRDLKGLATPQQAARSMVRDALTGKAGEGWVDDVVLVADELVGNAVQHAGEAIGIELDLYSWGATVQVRDGDADTGAVPGALQMADEFDEGGRGLFLVGVLASAWGVQPDVRGKRVVAVFLNRAAGVAR
ncbi:ATP-binding protein [Streptomyces sp. NPDC001389]|uniref:ATP-binding protein n=1 Tax=Streptomyces sp. NPDC001389 TaxID=3364569 RepID=UPI0036990316